LAGSLLRRSDLATLARPAESLDVLATTPDDFLLRLETLERLHGRLDDIHRVVVADALGQHIANTGEFDHRAHTTTSDHARTGRGRLEDHVRGTVGRLHLMRDGVTVQGYIDERLLGGLDTLADAVRYLTALAVSDADTAVAVANDHDAAEGEPATALDHLGYAVDLDEPFLELVGPVLFPATRAASISVPIHT